MQQTPVDTGHMLPRHEKKSAIGPVVGIIVIFLVMIFGALYFWGASQNRQQEQLPFIPGDSTQ